MRHRQARITCVEFKLSIGNLFEPFAKQSHRSQGATVPDRPASRRRKGCRDDVLNDRPHPATALKQLGEAARPFPNTEGRAAFLNPPKWLDFSSHHLGPDPVEDPAFFSYLISTLCSSERDFFGSVNARTPFSYAARAFVGSISCASDMLRDTTSKLRSEKIQRPPF